MKQVYLLDKADMADLRAGKSFNITFPDAVIEIRYEANSATASQRFKPGGVKCDWPGCQDTRGFASAKSVLMHKVRMHKWRRKK